MVSMFLRFPGGKGKAVTFSYDDGVKQDKRLAALFDRYGLKATFNLRGETCSEFHFTKEEIRTYFLDKGHEIAVHGERHRASGHTTLLEGIRDVLNCRLELEAKCERLIRGMAYAGSGINVFRNGLTYGDVKAYLTELDIAYARTAGGTDTSFELPTDFHAWAPTAHHDHPEILAIIDRFLQLDVVNKAYYGNKPPRLLYIWGHSYEFDAADNWNHMEAICQKVAGDEDVWYATNIEIYDYVQAYRKLQRSADGIRLYNPTLYALWFDVDGVMYHIEPGQTLRL